MPIPIQYEEQAALKFLTLDVGDHLKTLADAISTLQNFSKEGIEAFLMTFTQERNIKFKVLAQPLRVALTGKTVSPGIDDVMVTLGQERVVQRISAAVSYIERKA